MFLRSKLGMKDPLNLFFQNFLNLVNVLCHIHFSYEYNFLFQRMLFSFLLLLPHKISKLKNVLKFKEMVHLNLALTSNGKTNFANIVYIYIYIYK